MKKVKNKESWIKYLWHEGILVSLLFIFFFNYCEAQKTLQVLMETSINKDLSGIYSSKNQSDLHQKDRLDPFNQLPDNFPVNDQNYKEEIDKRTLTSRTYNNYKGEVVIQYSSKSINYLDKQNKFQPINTNLSFTNSDGLNQLHKKSDQPEWSAKQQDHPTYLFSDGSTALSSDENDKIIFNKNCKINAEEINYTGYTVGQQGMFINNVIEGVDKKIIFDENTIETDYIIRHKISDINQDLIISEEIGLPHGYYISTSTTQFDNRSKEGNCYTVYSSQGIEQAKFNAPIFYDANKIIFFGTYNLVQQQDKIILEMIIPEKWLNDVNRVYPITIDPVVTGPTSNYPVVFMNSCVLPTYAKDSMLVTIPAGITITKFIVEDSYFADALSSPAALMTHGRMGLSTSCGAVTFSCQGTTADSSGTCYLVPNTDLKEDLACCFIPSCAVQTFYLTHSLARDSYGPGCNQDYVYYSPLGNWPFSAFIVGKTVETAQAQWSVFPTTVCSDSCTVFLKVTTNYGVPPYTITHPWAIGPLLYGTSADGCTSTGSDTIALTIPGCPTTCGTNPTLSIPPPCIVDVCGDSVTGLSSKSITIKPVPVATASPVSVCSGSTISIPLSSCVNGSSFQWLGSNGSSGTGNINDMVLNNGSSAITIDYSVIPSANGCVGAPISVSAEIDTLPVINAGLNDTIEPGVGTQLNAIGGFNYLWAPTSGLSCSNCPNPLATPVISTIYYVTGTSESGCSSVDTIEISVTQGGEVLYIPNSFSPNENNLNDLFYAYGTSIKTFDIQIYDRWGELIFHSSDIKLGWDGKYKGKKVEGGVYVYTVNCEFQSGVDTYRNGIVTVWR